MPFLFGVVGLVFITAGVRGTAGNLLLLLKGDIAGGGQGKLVGSDNFIFWMLSIGIIGALGYIEDFRPLSRALMVLILVVLVIAEDNKAGGGGFFAKFQDAVAGITGSNQAAA
jgi:hypothetical protein